MPIDPTIFKAYDVRGLYGDQIDEDVAYRIGRGFARVLADMYDTEPGELRLALGRDMRLQAPGLAERYAAGMADEGASVAGRGPGGHRDALLDRRARASWTAG